jgi:hypothetical protein
MEPVKAPSGSQYTSWTPRHRSGRPAAASRNAVNDTDGGNTTTVRSSRDSYSSRNRSTNARVAAGPWFIFQLPPKNGRTSWPISSDP